MVLKTSCLFFRNSCRSTSSSFRKFKKDVPSNNFQKTKAPKILITGGLGQLGVGCAKVLREIYGTETVILSDILKPSKSIENSGPFMFADVLDAKKLHSIITNHRIDWIIHFAAVLSALAEQNIFQAAKVNIEGLHNVMNLALQYNLRIFVPSSIAAFGEHAPLNLTPDNTIQRPRTIYGVGKVYAELLGEYYNYKYGLDFRCLRLPGVISYGIPGGGTTDYATTIFNEAINKACYECYLKPDTVLPMIYIDDCLRAVAEFMSISPAGLRKRTYNIAAMSFAPKDLASEIKKYVPNFVVTYNPDYRQNIADSWPKMLDDSEARKDWLWYSQFNLESFTEIMFEKYISSYKKRAINVPDHF